MQGTDATSIAPLPMGGAAILDPEAVRRWLHAHPELSGEETRTAALVAGILGRLGYTVHEGVGGNGVVGLLGRGSGPTIALRADMDALPIQETGNAGHRSVNPGRMHACGHDGHTAILLGAAEAIAAMKFSGRVVLIFQPAEELGTGARAMLEHAMFDTLQVDAVAGLHNWPDIPQGTVAVRSGPVMASSDRFGIRICGEPSHPALPHQGSDVIAAAAALVPALQETFLRRRAPHGTALISVTDLIAEGKDNAIPAEALLRGTVRCLNPAARAGAVEWLETTARSIAARHGAVAEVTCELRCKATVNDGRLATLVAEVAAAVVGGESVFSHIEPAMTGDDFAYFAERWPGVYLWLGTGHPGARPLHDPAFDFNDAVLPTGIELWRRLVERFLSVE